MVVGFAGEITTSFTARVAGHVSRGFHGNGGISLEEKRYTYRAVSTETEGSLWTRKAASCYVQVYPEIVWFTRVSVIVVVILVIHINTNISHKIFNISDNIK